MTARSASGSGRPPGQHVAGQRQRQERIRERVIADSFVRVEQLAEEFAVSIMTVHRDLDVLESQGWLRKVRGGATAQPSALYHGDVRHRMRSMSAQKESLARYAVDLLEPGQSVILDDSTTVLQAAEYLGGRGPFTVVTNFLAVVRLLAGEPGIDLVGLGGTYYAAYDAFLGIQAVEAVRSMRADVLLCSTTAITAARCYHLSQETIQVKRALMNAADRRILLVDHTKFAKRALHELAPLSGFDDVLVDEGVPEETMSDLADHGIEVTVVPTVADSAGGPGQ